MTSDLLQQLDELCQNQRSAVDWNEGTMMVLAGRGTGKTRVLTARIARILEETRNRHFRVLALTFTNKAGDEMRTRVEQLVPGMVERTAIGTFHSFCARVLRQHGSHVSINPDFAIYDQEQDRTDALSEALQVAKFEGQHVSIDDVKWLNIIDRLRGELVTPRNAPNHIRDRGLGPHVSLVYSIYEKALRRNNAMDFNGLILDTCRLISKVPALAEQIRQTHPFWLIDEFQDTTRAQYRLIELLAGDDFDNIVAVADDDQIIYEWAGASYQRIHSFRKRFSPKVIQLTENRRCPKQIVDVANNLISHNTRRASGKEELVPTAQATCEVDVGIRCFETDIDEATNIANSISKFSADDRGRTVVLGRTRKILDPVLAALVQKDVDCKLAIRRDQFVSPQFIWLQNALNLALRPTDRQSFKRLVGAGNRMASLDLDANLIASEAACTGRGFLEYWTISLADNSGEIATELSNFALRLVQHRESWESVVQDSLDWLPSTANCGPSEICDVDEDKAAWNEAYREIVKVKGYVTNLDELLQGIALRSKEPPVQKHTVRLMTIHGAKGLEFDYVWVMGLADSILPSWQSLKPNAKPLELEAERRNLFVAITRTQKKLFLSYARQYDGRSRNPSQFLSELGSLDKVSF